MKESAIIALEYIKSHAEELGLDSDELSKRNVHLHVPQGAIPKDGPSAGITMVSAMVSAFTRRKIRKAVAMTGEITLRGQVLPVGGIKEKILAAKRAGIKEIILCERNRQDIDEIDARYLKGLTFTFVGDIMEVVNRAVLQTKVG
jgi:ATP-dependent Lon protease